MSENRRGDVLGLTLYASFTREPTVNYNNICVL